MLGGWTGRPPRLWRRYIDDIIFLWSGSKEELTLFIQYLNQFHPTIKFKCNDGEHFNFESKSVNFLDTTLYIDSDGFIQSTLYTKPGKLCQYLLPSFSHPNHMSRNIPYSLAYRLLRIESVREKLILNLQKLRCDLIIRKYNPKVIQLAFDRVLALNRLDSLKKVIKKQTDCIPLVIPYHPGLPQVSKIVLKHWRTLCRKLPAAKLFLPEPPMVCYSKDKNLQDHLVRATLPPLLSRTSTRSSVHQGFVKCGKRADCSHSEATKSIKMYKRDGSLEQLEIKKRITCTDENLVYIISCTKQKGACAKVHPQYVGETGNPSQANLLICPTDTTLPVGVHFRLPGHSHTDLQFTPIEKIQSKDPYVRRIREMLFIQQFETLKGKGTDTIEHGLTFTTSYFLPVATKFFCLFCFCFLCFYPL